MRVPVRREALQAAPRGPPGADSPSGLVLLSQSQASTMRVKERCGRGEAASGSSSLPSRPRPRDDPLERGRCPLQAQGPGLPAPAARRPAD